MRHCIPCCPVGEHDDCQVVFVNAHGVDVGHCTLPNSKGDEVRTCSVAGRTLVVPGLLSGVVYLVDLDADVTALASQPAVRTVTPQVLTQPFECVAAPEGDEVYVSCKGGLLVVKGDGSIVEHTSSQVTLSGGITVSAGGAYIAQTTWADADSWRHGHVQRDVARGKYGSTLCVWRRDALAGDGREGQLAHAVDLGVEGVAPLAVRLWETEGGGLAGYVACCPIGNVFYVWTDGVRLHHVKCIEFPKRLVEGRRVPSMPTGLEMSADGTFLFVALWLEGEVRQYDVSTPSSPILVGLLARPHVGAPFTPATLAFRQPGAAELLLSTGFLRAWHTQLCEEAAEGALYLRCIPSHVQGHGYALAPLAVDPLFRYTAPGYRCMRPAVIP
eukprot:TRINITY_DN20433_c0_g1_i1.p1 TRINITY_DN20433_c0_g1~~TRINITY_DN20433_c0_g1_i1.p1  ORF type:complete len:386 (+),score=99.78 TRINITY_DN20433_c0_g1_i1:76-1233(+)